MNNFEYVNPVKIVFGEGSVKELSKLLPKDAKILLLYGGGSIKANGAYEQVVKALGKRKFKEFSGVEANPEYETCMSAVKFMKKHKLNFILAVGGGSVIDACKFIASAMKYKGKDKWQILESMGVGLEKALPFASVLTLPATGSEMNNGSVISRRAIGKKLFFYSPASYPQFSVLDPTFMYTLPKRQLINGVVDAFVHVCEQYLTFPVNSPIQDRFSEGIIDTLIQEGPKLVKNNKDYDVCANVMLSATFALNGLINIGVPQDWSTHKIGHELTAQFGLDHAQTLAIILPSVMRFNAKTKAEKIIQMGKRCFGVKAKTKQKVINDTIVEVEKFFKKLGIKTKLADYKINAKEVAKTVGENIMKNYPALGENQDIKAKQIQAIVEMS